MEIIGGEMTTEFNTSTPDNINEYRIEDVVQLIKDSENISLPSPKVRLRYVEMLYDVLGLQLTPDAALASIAEPQSLMALSIAGGGKTTWSQTKAILQKLIRPARKQPRNGPIRKISGDKILCLVYNRHNVQDMKLRHKQLVNRMRLANIKGLDIDDEINASTLHAFCEFWRKEYVLKMDLLGLRLIDEAEVNSAMTRAIKISYKLKKLEGYEFVSPEKCAALYTLMIERMCKSVSELSDNDKYQELELDDDLLALIFIKYEEVKRMKKCYDFTDVLFRFNKLLEEDPSVKKHVQLYYEYIIADEVQDFTPLMWSILRKLVDNGTPLTVIGDEDQNIYRFRGAALYDILHFDSIFPDAKVYMLEQNRRCRKEILDTARSVISENTLRFNKQLLGCKDGGEVRYVPYNTEEGQVISLIMELKKLTPDELSDTVVCYRNKENSMLLTDMLEEEGIDFNVISGVQPLSYELYRHVIAVLNLLEQPYDRMLSLNLYKVLPCSKAAIAEVIGYNFSTKKFKEEDKHIHFAAYYYGNLRNVAGFSEIMDKLISLSNKFESLSTKELFDEVWHLIERYFWKYKKEQNNNLAIDNIFEERVKKFFDSELTYDKFFSQYSRRVGIARRNTELRAGLSVSTFHSLKGLEFSRVYAIELNNDNFPNFSLIEARGYSAGAELELKEAETRLWYVAVTRAKDLLTIYYDRDNPSYYVQKALDISVEHKVNDLNNMDYDPEFEYLCSSVGIKSNNSNNTEELVLDDKFTSDFADDVEECFADGKQVVKQNNEQESVQETQEEEKFGEVSLKDLQAQRAATSPNAMMQSLLKRLMQ